MSFKSFFLLFVSFIAITFSQTSDPPYNTIKVQINSGNPVFPFPQFLPYKNPTGTFGNLADKNPMGVTHAEMEQTMRDAYQIAMNRAYKPGGGVGGVDYIYFDSDCHCTEGDGYGMLAAVSMADKTTFDGLWLYVHDTFMHKVKRYRDCKINDPEYEYSTLPGVYHNPTDNSATDGDVDIAFALFCAYKQWGEFMGINDAEGNPISYKQASIEILKGLTDTLIYVKNNLNYLSGDIGLDGYLKSGDSWGELTNWASDTTRSGFPRIPEFKGPQQTYFDYSAPSYFHEWAAFLSCEDSSTHAWNIKQFQRAEASADWLMGQILTADPAMIPYIGRVSMSADNKPAFEPFNEGEDFRLAWRTILNYVWHGNPSSTWDPESHQVISGKANTFERDIGLRYAKFLSDTRQSPWNNPCIEAKDKLASYWGPMVLLNRYTPLGKPLGSFFLNWIPGTGSISAVAAQDYNLMADLYRYCEIEWFVKLPGDGYLTSVPFYFHEWFRMLGLLVSSGNYQAPSEFKPTANMKVYMSIDKTFAFVNDTVTYTIDYRNYGSLNATNTVIIDTLHNDFVFLSATGGGVFNSSNHTITWNIGTVPGFKTTAGIDPTKGQVQFKVKVGNANQKQYRNRATISCSNGTGWTSNEFPNHITSVMERNYLDIAKRALIIKKTSSATRVKPGTSVQFTIDFENTSEAGWINGGRPGIHFSFSQSAGTGNDPSNVMRFRLFHDAQEGYIDYGNYRVSYFLYDSLIKNLGSTGNDTGWILQRSIIEGIDSLKLVHELITPGEDSLGKWNQRVIVQFSDPTDPNRIPKLATIDHHLSEYRGKRGSIHRGGTDPLRLVWFLNNTAWMKINWNDDWSWDPKISQSDGDIYFPVTNDWTDLQNPDVPVNTWNPRGCETSERTVNNILVEEWDGYTWRRVAGNGPLPGRDAINVVIRDTLPQGLTFTGFTSGPTLGIEPVINGNVITWKIPKLQIKQKGTITYTAIADGSCPLTPDLDIVDRAWISAEKESPVADSSLLTISCDSVPKPPTADHLDIVLDTFSVDLNHDTQIESINIDANTENVKLFAAVRDKKGNFMSWANASWTSSNPSIGSIAVLDSMTGLVTRISSGTITVIVSQNGLKPDSIMVYVAQLPPWPVTVSAKMLDTNADIIPDLLHLMLSDTFHLNQRPDSIVINYLGKTYSIPATNTILNGTSLSVPFTSLFGVDPQPAGISTLVMTVNNDKKRDSKVFIDGVCPAIKSCLLHDKVDSSSKDTLSLKFFERISTNNLKGTVLLLIRNGTADTIPLQATVLDGQEFSDSAIVTVSGAFSPSEGDLLRFVPGASGNTVADMSGNTPHLLNRPVTIRTKPPVIKSAWYTDKNGDGTVETVYLTFNKAVDVTNFDISLNWSDIHSLDHMKSPMFINSPSDHSIIVIDLPYDFTSNFSLKTGGNMIALVEFLSAPDDPQSIWVADSASPVLTSAVITPGISSEENNNSIDTLNVSFSEGIIISDKTNPFFIQRSGKVADTMDLKLLYVNGNDAVFLVSGYHGLIFPVTGDSMWIRPATISDTGSVWQNVYDNHKVALLVKPPQIKWKIVMGPNPIHTKNPDPKITFSIKPLIKTRVAFSIEAKITIYDALGNIVVHQADFKNPTGTLPIFVWNGRNLNGRLVGTGTYVGKIIFSDGTPAQTVKIGVKR